MIQSIQNFRKWWNRPKSWFADLIQTLVVFLPLLFIIRTWVYGLYVVPSGSMETTLLVGERLVSNKFTYIFSKPQRGDVIAFNEPAQKYRYSSNKWKRLVEKYVWGPSNWTKRIIGLPGDHVQGMVENGKTVVYLNGEKLDEPYLNAYPLVRFSLTSERRHSYDPARSCEDQPFYMLNKYTQQRIERQTREMETPYLLEPGTPVSYHADRSEDVYDVQLKDNEYWVMGDNRLGSDDSRFWGPLDGSLIHGKIVFRLFSIDTDDSWVVFDLIQHPISFWKRVRWSRFFQVIR